MLFDLHVHTRLSSCSQLSMEEILIYGRSLGLDGVCITDHDTMDARHQCEEGFQADGLCVIFGMEYATSEGDFLIFGPFEGLAPGLSASALLSAVEAEGGVAIAAHPFRKARPTEEGLILDGRCRFVEGVNGRNLEEENIRAISRFRDLGVSFVGGSDAHALEELGRVRTRFDHFIHSRETFIAALKEKPSQPFCPAGRVVLSPGIPLDLGL